MSELREQRSSFDEANAHPWHLGMVDVDHKVWKCGVYVVHGMGDPGESETAAILRFGFDDALEFLGGEPRSSEEAKEINDINYPPPFILEGYWANYTNLKESFPEEWESFSPHARSFFEHLWKMRLVSRIRTLFWFIGQMYKLLCAYDKNSTTRTILAWLLYVPLLVFGPVILLIALFKAPKVLTGYLADVRLYLAPKGVTERAIVQHIDRCVAIGIMKMLGLDTDFRTLPPDKKQLIAKRHPDFERVIWVSHSLGTVVSYNVLSDLFHKAAAIDRDYPEGHELRLNVERFRKRLKRFVTVGSPLDKVAHVFGKSAIRPWPMAEYETMVHESWVHRNAGESKNSKKVLHEWWVNYFHGFDPVSGSLDHSLICGKIPPSNIHMKLFKIPGWAHVAYWRDTDVLSFILSRCYGAKELPYKVKPVWLPLRMLFLFIFFALQLAVLGLIIWAIICIFSNDPCCQPVKSILEKITPW